MKNYWKTVHKSTKRPNTEIKHQIWTKQIQLENIGCNSELAELANVLKRQDYNFIWTDFVLAHLLWGKLILAAKFTIYTNDQ